MKYLKLFNQHTEYNTYITSLDKILPNVSYCVLEDELHFTPYTDPRLIVKYTVEDDSDLTLLYGYHAEEGEEDWVRGIDLFDKIEIDGAEVSISDIDSDDGAYQLSEGEHIAKYTLKDPTTIGDSAFSNCNSLTSITIPNSVTTIGVGAFSGNSLTSITIPDSVTTIGAGAFSGCGDLTSITIPNSVTTISDGVFYCCSGLTNIVIPSGVTSIGMYAFFNCGGLTNIVIPSGVTTIGENAFYNCRVLTSATIQATTPPTLGSTVFNYTNNCPIYVPSASVEAYKAANNWSTYASRIQAIS